MLGGLIDEEDIIKDLNDLEYYIRHVGADDEYLAGLLKNTKVMAQVMAANGGTVDKDNLPLKMGGIAVEPIEAKNTGFAVFYVEGSRIITEVEVEQEVNKNEVIKISGSGNKASPIRNVEREDLLGAGNSGAASYQVFDRVVTTGGNGPDGNVIIEAGETKDVLTYTSDTGGRVMSIGTFDLQYSKYQYYIDGNPLLSERLPEPLGQYDAPYRFPIPIRFNDSVRVEVKRLSGANSSDDYASKITVE